MPENAQNPRVYLENHRTYDVEAIAKVIADGVTDLGVAIPRQSRVLVKPNVLGAYAPERYITTHPAVVEAVIRVLLDNGNSVVVADSSCIPGGTGRALEQSGMMGLKALSDAVSVCPFEEFPTRPHSAPGNRFLHEANLAQVLDDVECIVNVPKLKSHMLTKLTGAVKNLFGCIPGGGKQQAHVIAPSAEAFSHLLVDLYSFIKPRVRLNIIDAIVGIDGMGPGTAGRKNELGFIGLSTDAAALDMACCNVIRVDPQTIYTNRFAVERGLADEAFETNRDLAPVRFRVPGSIPLQAFLSRYISGLQRRRPTVVSRACERCGACAEVCPVQCITIDGEPRWDYDRCIYCYCCHEGCPHAAIKLKVSMALLRR